jgi:hypothetical protein
VDHIITAVTAPLWAAVQRSRSAGAAKLRPSPGPGRRALQGALAGAAGTTALNAVTYLDMSMRGRGASSTPEQSVEELADRAGTDVPGKGETRQNRVSGLGPMLGIGAGVGAGVAIGLLRGVWQPPAVLGAAVAGLAAMAAGSAPMAVLGVSDPREWSPGAWLTDALPHAAYGVVVEVVLELMTD